MKRRRENKNFGALAHCFPYSNFFPTFYINNKLIFGEHIKSLFSFFCLSWNMLFEQSLQTQVF